jgi:hypothetical protein
MLPTIAAVPADPTLASLGALLGPTALLAAAAVVVVLGMLIFGLFAERGDRARRDRMRRENDAIRPVTSPPRARFAA